MEDSFEYIDESNRSANSKKLAGALAEATEQIRNVTKETAQKIDLLADGIQGDSVMIELAEQRAIQAGFDMKLTRQ